MKLPCGPNGKKMICGFAVFLIFLFGFILGFYFEKSNYFKNSGQEKRLFGYKFINPLIDHLDSDLEIRFKELKPFREEMVKFVNKKVESDEIISLGIYFRDLNSGRWYGINEKETFIGASLLKVGMMIAFLKEAETNPDILNKEIKFESPSDDTKYIGGGIFVRKEQYTEPSQNLEIGKSYTILELIERMIINSDNDALFLLDDNISTEKIKKIFNDFGVYVEEKDGELFTSPTAYSNFFRILYNSSYLDKKLSEKALEILSQSEYKNGLVAGVPKNIIVSHKFGERGGNLPLEVKGTKPTSQLHDCGIIYHPQKTYLLCVMTKGYGYENLAETIKEISEMVYNQIEIID